MKKNIVKIMTGLLVTVSILSILYITYQKSKKQDFIKECPFCNSKKLSHAEPKYKFTENYVIPSISSGTSSRIGSSGGIIKPIAHFDVKYHCNDCNKTFSKELEVDLLLKENQNKFQINYKE